MPFEGWAILEIMGHRRIAGFVREVELFGAKMAQVEVPALPEKQILFGLLPAVPAFTQLFAGAAIFSTIPTTEAIALAAAENIRLAPPREVEPLPAVAPRLLGSSAENDDDHMGHAEDDEAVDPQDPVY